MLRGRTKSTSNNHALVASQACLEDVPQRSHAKHHFPKQNPPRRRSVAASAHVWEVAYAAWARLIGVEFETTKGQRLRSAYHSFSANSHGHPQALPQLMSSRKLVAQVRSSGESRPGGEVKSKQVPRHAVGHGASLQCPRTEKKASEP